MLTDNDSSWVAERAIGVLNTIQEAWTRPSVLFHPTLYRDGNQWCCLLGVNLMEGVAGFGDTPDIAACEFDRAWARKLEKPKTSYARVTY